MIVPPINEPECRYGYLQPFYYTKKRLPMSADAFL